MEIDAKKIRTEIRPLPPNELVITPETLDRLRIPDEVALRPENVIPFLASQNVRYNEIVNRPEIKTLESEIPPYLHEEQNFLHVKSPVSPAEQEALSSWTRDKLMNLQSDEDIDQLAREIDGFVDDTLKDNPGLMRRNEKTDPLEMMMTSRLIEETEEERRKFWEALAAAKGSPDAVNSILGYRYARQMTKKIGKFLEMYKFHVDVMDKLQAGFDLKNQKGPISAADLAKFNADFARGQADTVNLFQMITHAMNDYQRITQDTAQRNMDIKRPLEVMIQNMRT